MAYEIKLDVFEGPLDLLLYLIRKNEIDIYDIPISLVAQQYMEYLNTMRSLNLDLAGEYLVMAATLAHIKSRMLLPTVDTVGEEDEEEDPRAELVRQLLEYQRYKEAAGFLAARPLLERDVFNLGVLPEGTSTPADDFLLEVDLFELVEAFRRILSQIHDDEPLEFSTEKLSLADRMNEIMETLSQEGNTSFSELLIIRSSKRLVVYTFLAILELVKLRMVTARQAVPFGEIRLFLSVGKRDEITGTSEGA